MTYEKIQNGNVHASLIENASQANSRCSCHASILRKHFGLMLGLVISFPLFAAMDYEKTFIDDDRPGIIYHYEFVGNKYGDSNRDVILTRVEVRTEGQFAVEDPVSISPGVYAASWGVRLREIGGDAFAACEYIKSVTLPGTLRRVGSGAFRGCHNLESVSGSYADGALRIEEKVFSHCTHLKTVNIPNQRVYSIGDGAFSNCTALVMANLGNELAQIGNHTFYGCTSLVSYDIPSSVTEVGRGVFSGCQNLKSVYFRGVCPKADDALFEGAPVDLRVVATGDYFEWPINESRWKDRPFSYDGITIFSPYPRTEEGQQVFIVHQDVDTRYTVRYVVGSSGSTDDGITYTSPFTVRNDTVIRAARYCNGKKIGEEKTLELAGVRPTPIIGATFNKYGSKFLTVSLESPRPNGSKTYFSFGDDVSIFSEVFNDQIVELTSNTTVRVFATAPGLHNSLEAVTNFTFEVSKPTIRVNYADENCTVMISCSDPFAVIRYTLDGSDPTEKSSLYAQPVKITKKTTVKARAYRENWTPSAISTSEVELRLIDESAIAVSTSEFWSNVLEVSYRLTADVDVPDANVYFRVKLTDRIGWVYTSSQSKILTGPDLTAGDHVLIWDARSDVSFISDSDSINVQFSLMSEKEGVHSEIQTVSRKVYLPSNYSPQKHYSYLYEKVEIPTDFGWVESMQPDTVRLAIDGEFCGEYGIGENVCHTPLHCGDNEFSVTYYKNGEPCSKSISQTINVHEVETWSGTYAGLDWDFNTSNGVFRLSGSGSMTNGSQFDKTGWLSTVKAIAKSVEISNGVTSIGNYAFYQFPELESVKFPEALREIGQYAFYGCSKLKQVDFPSTLTTIGKAAFNGCNSISTIEIPPTVKEVAQSAFGSCSSLSCVYLKDGVESIGSSAFSSCPLSVVKLPKSVVQIEASAFRYCSGFELIFDGNAPKVSSNVGSTSKFSDVKNAVAYVPEGSTGWDVKIPGYTIEPGTWYGLELRTREPIQVRFDYNFEGSDPIVVMNHRYGDFLSEMPTPIRVGYDFEGWFDINGVQIVLGRLVDAEIVGYARWKKQKYCTIRYDANGGKGYMPSQKVRIGSSVHLKHSLYFRERFGFRGWSQREDGSVDYVDEAEVLIQDADDGEEIILYAIWEESPKLVYDELGDAGVEIMSGSTVEIGSTVSLPKFINGLPVVSVGSFALHKSVMTTLDIPGSVTNIGKWAFERCANLVSVIIPASVVRLEYGAFDSCSALTFVSLPDSVVEIGNSTFASCRQLKEFRVAKGDEERMRGLLMSSGFDCSKVMFVESLPVHNQDVHLITYRNLMNAAHENPMSYKRGATIVFKNPTPIDGYEFAGWDCPAVTADYDCDLEVSAIWNTNQYSIAYHANDGSGEEYVSDRWYGQEFRIAICGFVRDGFSFMGWSVAPNGEVLYQTGDVVKNLTTRKGKTINLYAVWEKDLPPDPIPILNENATAQEVLEALAGSEDVKLLVNITDALMYGKYRAWAISVGAEAVKSSPYAWISFAVDSATLLDGFPDDDDLTIEQFKPTSEAGKFDFMVSVKDVEIGSEAQVENLKKVFDISGADTLDKEAFSPSNVTTEFGKPQNGKVLFSVRPSKKANAFFMTIKMKN